MWSFTVVADWIDFGLGLNQIHDVIGTEICLNDVDHVCVDASLL